jgi:hypothetical protein
VIACTRLPSLFLPLSLSLSLSLALSLSPSLSPSHFPSLSLSRSRSLSLSVPLYLSRSVSPLTQMCSDHRACRLPRRRRRWCASPRPRPLTVRARAPLGRLCVICLFQRIAAFVMSALCHSTRSLQPHSHSDQSRPTLVTSAASPVHAPARQAAFPRPFRKPRSTTVPWIPTRLRTAPRVCFAVVSSRPVFAVCCCLPRIDLFCPSAHLAPDSARIESPRRTPQASRGSSPGGSSPAGQRQRWRRAPGHGLPLTLTSRKRGAHQRRGG